MEEVLRYGEAFWRQGPKTFSEEAWKRIKARVEIKEKRLNEVKHVWRVSGGCLSRMLYSGHVKAHHYDDSFCLVFEATVSLSLSLSRHERLVLGVPAFYRLSMASIP